MTFVQALVYFVREAFVSLVRSFKVSLLAVLTIGVSLFLGGLFLLVSSNLSQVIQGWRAEAKIVIYLEPEASRQERADITDRLRGAPWVATVQTVSSDEARRRFREAFPSLEDLLDGWGEEPLPASLEVSLNLQRLDPAAFETALDELRDEASIAMVDDDRDWLRQLETVILVLRGLGAIFGAVLLMTAIFTISSVIRLTAYLYRDEIAILRLVGATEFFIRGPFYLEGLIQGLLGGAVAVVGLLGVQGLVSQGRESSLLVAILATEFLDPAELVLLVGLGAFAGLFGAVTSLRRESLGQTAEIPNWPRLEED